MCDLLGPRISDAVPAALPMRSAPRARSRGHQMRGGILGAETARCRPLLPLVAARVARDRLNPNDLCGGAAARDSSVFQVCEFAISISEVQPGRTGL